ncbi:hypothetical protein [Bosea vaviloviae]|uniref:DUF1134 domain-containing protein n=1 Tax=Bosea vaviloviae TaxID=1526658 RepID=A0A1D7U635_9HYPH|nr:hypothetical protein [Bosea vaviloviae]AOO82817.1 hypothetical protein BHK69_22405 [Bosea vaviloviae]
MIKFVLPIALGCFVWSGTAGAQQRNLGPATGSVSIRQLQVAFIGSGAIGGGVLKFGGRSYDITVAGLGVGGIGASRLLARGPVYGLQRVDDFVGPYVQLREGWAIGDEGRGRLWLRNAKGVTLRLNTQRRGLQISLGADGVVIGFKQ